MGQDEPEPIQPEGDDPGTQIAESPSAEVEAQPDDGPEPEGADPGRIETFGLKPEATERMDLALKRESDD
jgi:hypothetical protein